MTTENCITLSYIRACKIVRVEVLQLAQGGQKQFTAFYPAEVGNSDRVIVKQHWPYTGLVHLYLPGNNDGSKADAAGWMSDRGAMEWAAMVLLSGADMMCKIRTEIEATESTPLGAKR